MRYQENASAKLVLFLFRNLTGFIGWGIIIGMKNKKVLLVFISLVLAWLFAAKMPQALFVPLGLLLWTFRFAIRQQVEKLPVWFGFMGSVWLLGMCIEVFAVWQNLPVAYGQRLLFEQDPKQDLAVAAVFYLLFAAVWFWLLRRYAFTPGQALFIQALWSLIEQRGAVLRQAVAAGPAGLFLLAFVAGVYGTWIFFPTWFTEGALSRGFPTRVRPRWYHGALALGLLYAVIGGLAFLS